MNANQAKHQHRPSLAVDVFCYRCTSSHTHNIKLSKNQAGFSLIELVMVMLLIGILAYSVISRWDKGGISVAAQAEQLMGDIRYVQSLSMTQGQRYRINFAADRYWFSTLDGLTFINHPATNTANMMLSAGTTLSSSQPFLVFDGRGAPFTDSALPGTSLAANATVTLTAAGQSRTVQISPETGRVVLL